MSNYFFQNAFNKLMSLFLFVLKQLRCIKSKIFHLFWTVILLYFLNLISIWFLDLTGILQLLSTKRSIWTRFRNQRTSGIGMNTHIWNAYMQKCMHELLCAVLVFSSLKLILVILGGEITYLAWDKAAK